jgi:hypothetical protein
MLNRNPGNRTTTQLCGCVPLVLHCYVITATIQYNLQEVLLNHSTTVYSSHKRVSAAAAEKENTPP